MATPANMAAAIESSGYLIEARVARVLEERHFSVQRNAILADPNNANKIIELDLRGGYFEWINEENKSTAHASVLVECKNNTQPFAFFVQRQQIKELNENNILYGGFPSSSSDPETKTPIPLHRLLEMKRWHHYCNTDEVATQFCTFGLHDKNKSKVWKAEPNENYSKSFSNLALMATQDWEGMFGLHLKSIQVQITYPVVVFQGPIYRVLEKRGKAVVEEASHVQLHHFANTDGQVRSVQIDLITETQFPTLIETILSELKLFSDSIKSNYDRLLRSALDQKLVASVHGTSHKVDRS